MVAAIYQFRTDKYQLGNSNGAQAENTSQNITRHARINVSEAAIVSLMPDVKNIAWNLFVKYGKNPAIEVEELEGIGLVALVERAKQYDISKGTLFKTYALRRVKGAMEDYIRSSCDLTRGAHALNQRVENAKAVLNARFDRDPSEAEIADYLGMDTQKLRNKLLTIRTMKSLSNPSNTDSNDFEGSPKSDSADPLEKILQSERSEVIKRTIAELPANLSLLIDSSYYGGLTNQQIAKDALAVDPRSIPTLRKTAIGELRERLAGRL